MWFEGLLQPSWWQAVLITLALTHFTIASVTIYLHRHSAHRALDLHPALAHVFRFWLWLTTGMTTKEWTAIHRKHHVITDVEGDPHSPLVFGIKKVFWQGAELYRSAGKDREMVQRYGQGTPADWIERNLYSRYQWQGVGLMLIVDLLLFGVSGITMWAVQMLWIPVLAAGVINGIGHYWGYRNFECPDAATNIVPFGFLIGGEELHNNHHTYPNSAKFSVKPWEFDIGWAYIRVLSALGLAKVRSVGPIVEKVPGKYVIDMDTVWAVLNDRFRVMSRFSKEVVAPLIEAECAKVDAATSRVLRQSKQLLCRAELLVNEADRQRIAHAIKHSSLIEQLYELRLQLQAVWAKRAGNKEELLEAFRAWCQRAEESGISTLKDFARDLRSYSVPQAVRA